MQTKTIKSRQVPFYIRWLSRFLLWLWGWTVVGDDQPIDKAVFITQHTSNWDGILTLAAGYSVGILPRWIGKKSLFEGGRRKFMKMCGGIEIDRLRPGAVMQDIVNLIQEEDVIWIYIAPEGTRKKVNYWREGFYLIAQEAGVPIVQGYLNYDTKEVGIGKSLIPSGDIEADMEVIRQWFAPVRPKYPEKASEIRLKKRTHRSN